MGKIIYNFMIELLLLLNGHNRSHGTLIFKKNRALVMMSMNISLINYKNVHLQISKVFVNLCITKPRTDVSVI